jgi:hypothetical protein
MLLAAIAALSIASAAHAGRRDPNVVKNWELDWRRCIAEHTGGIRIESLDGNLGFYGVQEDGHLGFHGVKGTITSVRIDRTNFPMRPPENEFDDHHPVTREPFLQALARGKRLQVFVDGKTEPVEDARIGDGKGVVKFLRECGK